jgi:hypothetical protein
MSAFSIFAVFAKGEHGIGPNSHGVSGLGAPYGIWFQHGTTLRLLYAGFDGHMAD